MKALNVKDHQSDITWVKGFWSCHSLSLSSSLNQSPSEKGTTSSLKCKQKERSLLVIPDRRSTELSWLDLRLVCFYWPKRQEFSLLFHLPSLVDRSHCHRCHPSQVTLPLIFNSYFQSRRCIWTKQTCINPKFLKQRSELGQAQKIAPPPRASYSQRENPAWSIRGIET